MHTARDPIAANQHDPGNGSCAHVPTPPRSCPAVRLPGRASRADRRRHGGRRRPHRPGHGPLRGHGQPPPAVRRHRAAALRIGRDAPGQRLDRRAVPSVWPERGPRGLHLRHHLGAGYRAAAAGGAVHPPDHRPELGLDRRHRRQGAHRPRRAGRSVHAGQRRRLQGQGPRRVGASAELVSRVEPGRARHDRGRLGCAGRDPAHSGPPHVGHVGGRGARPAPVRDRSPVHPQGRRGTRYACGRVEGARADDDERLPQPGVAAPEPRDRPRGLRDARAPGHRRCEPTGRGSGGEHDRAGAGAAVEHRGGDSWQRAAGSGGDPRCAPG